MSIYLLRAGKWEGLYAMAVIESAVLRKQPKPECGQIPKKLIMDDSNSTSCCFCHRNVRKSIRKVSISNA